PTAEYADYARWLERHAGSADGLADLAWWRSHLADVGPPVSFPTDRPRPAVLSDRGDRATLGLDADVTHLLRRFARDRRTTVSAIISAVHAVLLHRYSGALRLFVGIAASHRPSADFHDVVGFFVNWIPVKADFSDDPTFEAFLARWQDAR